MHRVRWDYESIARPDLELAGIDRKAIAARLNIGRLNMVMGMQRPLVSRLEGKADNHQVGGMGQDGADRVAHLNTPGSHSDQEIA